MFTPPPELSEIQEIGFADSWSAQRHSGSDESGVTDLLNFRKQCWLRAVGQGSRPGDLAAELAGCGELGDLVCCGQKLCEFVPIGRLEAELLPERARPPTEQPGPLGPGFRGAIKRELRELAAEAGSAGGCCNGNAADEGVAAGQLEARRSLDASVGTQSHPQGQLGIIETAEGEISALQEQSQFQAIGVLSANQRKCGA
jgi:hypothetical protein